MVIGACTITLSAPWVHSLKEKRMVVKSLVEKTKNKFNVSIAEVDHQDLHQSIVLGFVCATNETRQADRILTNVLEYIENNTEAEIVDIEREIL